MKRESKISDGPWSYNRQSGRDEIEIRNSTGGVMFRSTSYGLAQADAKFICEAPERIANLERVCKAILSQNQQRGYPFGDEWDAIVKDAYHAVGC